MNERWHLIPGYEHYEASTFGRIRSRDRIVHSRNRWGPSVRRVSGRILSLSVGRGGYLDAHVSEDGVASMVKVAHLVAFAFVGPRPSAKHGIAHWDGNRTNNVPSNLRWATSKENKNDELRHGTRLCGEKQAAAKLTADQVQAIRSDSRLLKEVAAQYGVSLSLISHIRSGRAWKHVA